MRDVMEFGDQAGEHVNEHGHACEGRVLDITFRGRAEEDTAHASMARCRVCKRELSIENGTLFDPYPPPVDSQIVGVTGGRAVTFESGYHPDCARRS